MRGVSCGLAKESNGLTTMGFDVMVEDCMNDRLSCNGNYDLVEIKGMEDIPENGVSRGIKQINVKDAS